MLTAPSACSERHRSIAGRLVRDRHLGARFGARERAAAKAPGLLNDGAALDPETGRWHPIPDLPAAIADAEAATTDRYLLVLGGCCSQDADAFTLDLLTDTWASLPPIPSPPCRDLCSRYAPVASLGDGFVTWGGMTESGPEADTQQWAEGSLLDLSK